MTKRENILAAISGALTGVTGVDSANIYRSRVTPFSRRESPALILEPVNDTADRQTVARTSWQLTFQVIAVVRADIPDNSADAIVNDVHNKIMTNATVLSRVQDIAPVAVDWGMHPADAGLGVITMQFVAAYQTDTLDISN